MDILKERTTDRQKSRRIDVRIFKDCQFYQFSLVFQLLLFIELIIIEICHGKKGKY